MANDFYDVLGVDSEASGEEIKKIGEQIAIIDIVIKTLVTSKEF